MVEMVDDLEPSFVIIRDTYQCEVILGAEKGLVNAAKYKEKLFLISIDFDSAFDRVSRSVLIENCLCLALERYLLPA